MKHFFLCGNQFLNLIPLITISGDFKQTHQAALSGTTIFEIPHEGQFNCNIHSLQIYICLLFICSFAALVLMHFLFRLGLHVTLWKDEDSEKGYSVIHSAVLPSQPSPHIALGLQWQWSDELPLCHCSVHLYSKLTMNRSSLPEISWL